ncbi:MAG: hypothetical protein LBE34_02120 [Flavobacteriaceae bacterium]|jgi:hypothetical protein|nr:hypothetical protein [Flavobacteriaceae bacterium]
MKRLIKISLSIGLVVAASSTSAYAQQQIIIGNKTSFSSPSSIMEFPDNDTRGMVLPLVDINNLTPNYVEGTLLLDSNSKKIKYYANKQWIELSPTDGDISKVVVSTQPELANMRTLIGSNPNTSTIGALVLDSTDKAMVLPRVENPQLTMMSPEAGTLVFDTKSKMLCVYNGKEWAFWEVE